MIPSSSCLFMLLMFCAFVRCSTNFFDHSNFHFDFHGTRSSRSSPPTKQQDNEYYKVLGLSSSAIDREIKQAYRKKAMKMHPDKGGNEEAFKKLVEAYEVLSDPKKRQLYDRFGKDGVAAKNENLDGDFRDLFNRFGGFKTSFSVPIVYRVELDLKDFLVGRKLTVMLPGRDEKFVLNIEAGMMHGMEIKGNCFNKLGNHVGMNVIFVLQQKIHPVYSRKNADLLMEMKISLYEALTGFEKRITHLDGKEYVICNSPNRMVDFGDVYLIEGLGMPVFTPNKQDPSSSPRPLLKQGRLFVKFQVKMPSIMRKFCGEEKRVLKMLLSEQEASDHTTIDPEAIGSDNEFDNTGNLQTIGGSTAKNDVDRTNGRCVLKPATLNDFGLCGGETEEEEFDFAHPFGSFFF